VFICHLSVVSFVTVPEKRVLGALVEELCFIEWLFQQHDARNFGNDLLSGFFLESLSRVLELVNALQVVSPMWWCFAPNVILLPIRCAWNWASMNLRFVPNWQQIGYGCYWQVNGLGDLNMTKQTNCLPQYQNSVDCVMLGNYQCGASIKNAFEYHLGILI
jgi:hypothetical protein